MGHSDYHFLEILFLFCIASSSQFHICWCLYTESILNCFVSKLFPEKKKKQNSQSLLEWFLRNLVATEILDSYKGESITKSYSKQGWHWRIYKENKIPSQNKSALHFIISTEKLTPLDSFKSIIKDNRQILSHIPNKYTWK